MFTTLAPLPPVAPRRPVAPYQAGERPLLSGRYEVILPDRNEVIFFTNSLSGAAAHLARAYGTERRAPEILDFLTRVEALGFLAVAQYGVRVRLPNSHGGHWLAKVRGTQPRPLPRYAVDDFVEATDAAARLPAYLRPGRVLTVAGVVAVNDPRPGRQWAYLVGGGAGMRVSEDRLAPVSPDAEVFDFEPLSD